MTLALRPYQRAAIDAIYGYFAASAGHPLVVMPTGTGKSVVMAAFIRRPSPPGPTTASWSSPTCTS